MATLKGGAGKTMNTFNIAGILSEKYKVLLIDADPQCNLSTNMAVDVSDPDLFTIRDIFDTAPKDQPAPNDVIFEHPISECQNIDIIPSSIMLFKSEIGLTSRAKREEILLRYIQKHIERFSEYDYVLIDTNPSMGIINTNAFYLADKIIISSDVSTNSINGAELFCSLWDEKRDELEKEDNIAALILCNVNMRTTIAKDLIDYTENAGFSRDIVIDQIIPGTVRLKDTELNHKPINVLYPSHKICSIYRTVVDKLFEKGVF